MRPRSPAKARLLREMLRSFACRRRLSPPGIARLAAAEFDGIAWLIGNGNGTGMDLYLNGPGLQDPVRKIS